MRRFVREAAFRLTKNDLYQFLDDHEDDLIRIFHEEIEKLDERIPEEEIFIDIHMAALGDELLRAALTALKRFLREV